MFLLSASGRGWHVKMDSGVRIGVRGRKNLRNRGLVSGEGVRGGVWVLGEREMRLKMMGGWNEDGTWCVG
jgi:hypothetical protein